VPALPSYRGSAYDRNEIFFLIFIFFNITPEGLHYGKIWTNIGRAKLGRYFDVTSGRAACEARSATWNSGYQLSIYSRIEENHGKPWSSWQVAGPYGCKLTSSQQFGIKYANPNVTPCLCVPALFEIKVYIFLLHFYVDILDEQQTVFHMFIIANCLGIDNFRFYCCAVGPRYVALARTAQKTSLPTHTPLLRACLLRPSRDSYWAIA
jgi:hypothetical protein